MLLEEHYVDFLIDNNLTQAQYLLLHLLHNKRLDLVKKYKDYFPAYDESDTMIGDYYTNDLITRGFLIWSPMKNHYIIGEKYTKVFDSIKIKLASNEVDK